MWRTLHSRTSYIADSHVAEGLGYIPRSCGCHRLPRKISHFRRKTRRISEGQSNPRVPCDYRHPISCQRSDDQTGARNSHCQHKGVDNCLSASVESLIERIVSKMVKSPQTIAQIMESVIDYRGFIAQITAIVKPKQCRYTNEEAKGEELCRKCVKDGMKLDPVVALNPSEIGKKLPTNISEDDRTFTIAYSTAALRSSSDHYNPWNA